MTELMPPLPGLSRVNGKAVIARLHNSDDELDLPQIMELMRRLTEEVTGDPTT